MTTDSERDNQAGGIAGIAQAGCDEHVATETERPYREQWQRPAVGASPGTLTPSPKAHPTHVRVIGFGPDDDFEEKQVDTLKGISAMRAAHAVTWISVTGLADLEVVRELGKEFGLHHLSLEDIVDQGQRPKVEQHHEYTLIIARMMQPEDAPRGKQVSIVLGEDFVLSFQPRPSGVFDQVAQRVRLGHFEDRKADFLAYSLLDNLIDGYFPIIEQYGERLHNLEDLVATNTQKAHAIQIHQLKRELLMLRRAIWPHWEMLGALNRHTWTQISEETHIHLRDCHDHCFQLMDVVETYREVASTLVDVYLSSVTSRTNENMQVLTIIATIFIPMTFIASVYGMNFEDMPELKWPYGYLYALGLMAIAAGGMLIHFKRKGWLFKRRDD